MSKEVSWNASHDNLEYIIAMALAEDLGDGDHTTLATIPETSMGQARLLVKEAGILAGIEPAMEVFNQVDPDLHMKVFATDGSQIFPGDIVFTVHGRIRSILSAERVALNIMQRMSGIATHARRLVTLIAGTGAKLLDTRKTSPGFRLLEKRAVRIGGGLNHRFGLYDMILIKDNHVDAAGGVVAAIDSVHKYLQKKGKVLPIEIEVRNMDELEAVLAFGQVDLIMLDNFSIPALQEAVLRIDGQFETEASGGIQEHNIRTVAETGVNYISVGALTHQIRSLDLSLKIF